MMVSKKQTAIDATRVPEKEDFEENESIKELTIRENILKLYTDVYFIIDQEDLDRHAKIKNFENAKPNATEAQKEINAKYDKKLLNELSHNGNIKIYLVDRELKIKPFTTKKYKKGEFINSVTKDKLTMIPFKAKGKRGRKKKED